MKKIVYIAVLAFGYVLTSCDAEFQDDVQSFDPVSGEVIVNFTSNQAAIQTDGNGNVTVPIEVNVSTVSTSDRTYSISVNELQTSALASQYIAENSVVIPAGSHTGTFNVTAVDGTLPTDPVDLVLNLETQETTHNDEITIALSLNCPLPAGFLTGMYELDTDTPCLNGGCFGNSPVVVEVMDLGENRRSFTANYLSQFNIGQPDMTFAFTLFCGSVIVDEEQPTLLACGGNSLTIGAAAMASTFDDTDDSSITINFTDDSISSCGGATQSSITLTKI